MLEQRNILFIDQFGDFYGGGQIIFKDIVNFFLKNNSNRIYVALPEIKDLANSFIIDGIVTYKYKAISHSIKYNLILDLMKHIITTLSNIYGLIKFSRKHKIGIIYCNGGRTFLLSWILSKILNINVIWHIHLILTGRQKLLVEYLGKSKNIVCVIVVSKKIKSLLSDSLQSKIQVVCNWVPNSLIIAPNKISKKQKYKKLKIVILGRIMEEKGQLNFLNSIQNMNGNLFKITIAGKIMGDALFINEFNKTIKKMKEHNFEINKPGFVNDIKNLLDEHDFLVMPSIVPEAFGLSIIEAASRGLVVIANTTGNIQELVSHNENGFLYDSNNPQSINILLSKILENKFDLIRIRKNAYNIVINNFRMDSQIKRIKSIIRNYDINEHKTKILFLEQYGSNYGGAQIILIDLIDYILQHNQYITYLALPEKSDIANYFINKNVDIFIYNNIYNLHPKINWIKNYVYFLFHSVFNAIKLIKYYKKENIDLVYCNGGRTYLIGFLIAVFFKISTIWHLHLVLNRKQKNFLKFFGKFKHVEKIISVSDYVKSDYIGTRIENKIKIVNNWARSDIFINPHEISKKNNFTTLKLIILGRISEEKGQLNFIEMISYVTNKKIEITLAGNFNYIEYENNFKFFIKNLKNKNIKVNLVGYIKNIKEELVKNDFLIVSSLIPEAHPLSVIEAFSSGVIVISNKIGSLSKTISHGKTGFLYNANNKLDIMNLFKDIFELKYDLYNIRKNAYFSVKENYFAPVQLRKIKAIIDKN